MKGYQILKIHNIENYRNLQDSKLIFHYNGYGLFEEEVTSNKGYLLSMSECMNNYNIPGFFESYRDYRINTLIN